MATKSSRPAVEVLASTLDDVAPISAWWGWTSAHTWGMAAALGIGALQDAIDDALNDILPDGSASQRARWYPEALERVRTGAPSGYIGTKPGWEVDRTPWYRSRWTDADGTIHKGSKYLLVIFARPRMTLPSDVIARDVAVVSAQCAVPETRAWGMALDLGLRCLDDRLCATYPEYAAWRALPKPAPPADLRDVYELFGFEYPIPQDQLSTEKR